jgi:dihydropteroate synthase
MIWQTSRRILQLGVRPLIMGIVNVTPDSFSDGGSFFDPAEAIAQALRLEGEGAEVIDLGAESTRPGAVPISAEEEWSRLAPVLAGLVERISIPLSIDTSKAFVAEKALAAGAEIINDVGAGLWDAGMLAVVKRGQAGYVAMHTQGRPATMQVEPSYEDVVLSVHTFLAARLRAVQEAGIAPERVLLDPGFGFGKTAAHNYQLLKRFSELTDLGRPLLIGVSRKSFLKKIAGEEGLHLSTVAAHVWGAALGAHVWRVHEVAAAVTAAKVIEAIHRS